MDDDSIFRIALICGIAGIFLLYFASERVKPSFSDGEGYVTLKGEAQSVTQGSGMASISMTANGTSFRVVAFSPDLQGLKKGSIIEVEGKAAKKGSYTEVVAERIRVF